MLSCVTLGFWRVTKKATVVLTQMSPTTESIMVPEGGAQLVNRQNRFFFDQHVIVAGIRE